MLDEGHTVGNHTVHHKNMAEADEKTLLEELHALEALYAEKIGGKLSAYYRPPEGRFSKENLICAKENGYTTVFWSFAYPDWDNGRQMATETAKRIILENAHNGEIMLLHPTSGTNAEILGDVIRTLKRDGYRFGTLDELTCGED
jgi:peptidoglycan-N-acetylmuramic acid deacetylase